MNLYAAIAVVFLFGFSITSEVLAEDTEDVTSNSQGADADSDTADATETISSQAPPPSLEQDGNKEKSNLSAATSVHRSEASEPHLANTQMENTVLSDETENGQIDTPKPDSATSKSVPVSSESTPDSDDMAVETINLEQLLDMERSSAGTIGSHGIQLGQLDTEIYVGGYMWAAYYYANKDDVYFRENEDISTFDIHYFNLLVSANIKNRVYPELNLEHEHGYDFKMRTGQLDIRIFDSLIVRVGLFIVPFGYFNENMANEYLTKVPRRPFVLTNAYIVPSNWSETGIQLRGQYGFKNGGNFNYAVYLVNGLEQAGTENDLGEVEVAEGGGVRSMRGNFRDRNDPDKAIGGRIGVSPFLGLEFGFSGYSGAYTIDGKQRLLMLGADAHFHQGPLSVRTEYNYVSQQTSSATITRQGYWVTVAYKLLKDYLEPALRWDQILYHDPDNSVRETFETEDNLRRLSLGLNFYPFPKTVPLLLVRAAYGFTWNKGTALDNDVFATQVAIGF